MAIAPNQKAINPNLFAKMKFPPLPIRFLLALAAAALPSCTTPGSMTGGTAYLGANTFAAAGTENNLPPDTVSFWDGGAGNGPARLHLDISKQQVDFFRGETLVGRSRVSSGDGNHPTPTGSLSILEKHRDHVSSRYGDFVFGDGTVAKANVDIKNDVPPAGSRFKGSPMTNFMRLTHYHRASRASGCADQRSVES